MCGPEYYQKSALCTETLKSNYLNEGKIRTLVNLKVPDNIHEQIAGDNGTCSN